MTGGRPVEEDVLARTFLSLGYLPSPARARSFGDDLGLPSLSPPEERSTTAEGWSRVEEGLRAVVESSAGDGRHVVPLSAGLDSRTVLALLCSRADAGRIETVTFGSPGTWDFEIGPRIAAASNLPHSAVRLDDVVVDGDDLAALVEKGEGWTPLLRTRFNRVVPERFGHGHRYWSGFLGDALSGLHLPDEQPSTWEEAIEWFIRRNSVTGPTSGRWTTDVRRMLPAEPLLEPRRVAYEDQLHLLVQQASYVRRTVVPTGYDYLAPFEDRRVVAAYLDLPRSERLGRSGHRDLLKGMAPRLWAMPASASGGLSPDASRLRRWMRRSYLVALRRAWRRWPRLTRPLRPGISYLDFDRAFRERPDYRDLAGDCVRDLRQRGVVDGLDLDEVWRRHRRGEIRAGVLLELVCSLEISLRVQEGWPREDRSW